MAGNQLIFSNKVVFVGGNAITLPTAAADPGSAVNGDLYYNTTDNKIRAYINGGWHVIQEDAISALTGDITASGPGSAAATIANSAVTNAKIANATIDLTTKVTGILPNSNTTAASTNTASAIVARDSSGNFSAGTITASLTGAASLNVLKAGDTMTGNLAMGVNKVTSSATPSANDDLTNKLYVDTGLSGKEPTISAGTTSQYWRGDKSWQTLDKTAVGLNNVDNVQQLPMSYLDTDNTLAADSDVKVPSQKAIKYYVDNATTNAGSALDGTFRIKNTGDQSKQIAFSAANIAASTTRTLTMPNANVDLGALTNSNISASAAIAYSKLSLTNSIVDADINGSAAIAYGKLALTGSIVNADVSASAAIALSKLAALTASRVLVSDGSGVVSASSVTSTTLGYLDATSSIQTQLNAKLDSSSFTDAAVTGKLITGFVSGSGTVAATDTILQAINKLDGNIALRALDADVIKKNGTVAFTAAQSMGGFKLTNLANGTNSNDAVNYSQLQAIANGQLWLAPILDPDLIDDSLSTPPTPVSDCIYIIGPSPTGAWSGIGAGHAVYHNGTSWVDILNRAVQVGDRFGIRFEHGALGDLGGNMVGNSFKIAQITNATPGSYAYSFHTPSQYETVLDNNSLSPHFGHSYNYNGSAWVEVAGPGVITAGDALAYAGNTLNVLVDNSTIEVNTDQLRVKAGGISDSHINASAAIALSKLAALTANKAVATNASGVLVASSVTDIELGYLSGVTSAIQTQLGGKASTTLNNLGSTAVNADIIAAADLTSNLGSSSFRWSNVFAGAVDSGASALTLKSSASNANVILNPHGTGNVDIKAVSMRQTDSASGSNWMETQYFDSLSLAANTSSPTEISSSLSFALASFNGAIINYVIKEATSNKTRAGQLYVCTDGSVASSSDQYSETAALGSASMLSLDAAIVGANVVIRYNNTHATNAATMRCQIRRLRT